jgi:hypothetical protein
MSNGTGGHEWPILRGAIEIALKLGNNLNVAQALQRAATLADFQRIVLSRRAEADLIESLQISAEALAGAGDALAAHQRTAAAIEVSSISTSDVNALKDDLRTIAAALRQDSGWMAAAQALDTIAKVISA